MMRYEIGYHSERVLLKLQSLLQVKYRYLGIEATANVNVPDQNNLLVIIQSDKYTNEADMIATFINVMMIEMFEGGGKR
jgi:hypothetical protein